MQDGGALTEPDAAPAAPAVGIGAADNDSVGCYVVQDVIAHKRQSAAWLIPATGHDPAADAVEIPARVAGDAPCDHRRVTGDRVAADGGVRQGDRTVAGDVDAAAVAGAGCVTADGSVDQRDRAAVDVKAAALIDSGVAADLGPIQGRTAVADIHPAAAFHRIAAAGGVVGDGADTGLGEGR